LQPELASLISRATAAGVVWPKFCHTLFRGNDEERG
jgi:hypothetical protein